MPARHRARLWLVLGASACTFAPTGEDWRTQLDPSGPCYEANLLDGLDTASTDEEHAVFACLDATGALDAYAPLDEALDGESRDGAIGLVLARWVADLPAFDLSLSGLLSSVGDLLADPSGLFDVLHIGLEVVYGQPWPWLGDSVPLNSQTALDAGLFVQAMPVAARFSTELLDDGFAPLDLLAGAARSDEARSLVWTAASVGRGEDPLLADLEASWAPDLGDALDRAADSSNDRWPGAAGNSLRDLGTALYGYESDGRITLDHLAEPLEPVLADTRLRDALEQVVTEQEDAGRIDEVPQQLLYLATVDARGGALTTGEDSALVSLVRLLYDANTEVDCSVDLVFFDVDISLGNLSVSLLETLARQDPSTVDGGVDLLGTLLGVSLTDDILDAVADSGACPVIDDQLVEDLHAVDRLGDPQTDELLYVLLDVLSAFDDQGKVPDLVDTLGEAHSLGLVPPVEEALRDLGDTALATDLLGALPILLDPWSHHDTAWFPAGIAPLDFDGAWSLAATLLTADETGATPLGQLAGPFHTVIAQSGTWTSLATLATLLQQPDALTPDVLELLPAVCEADPTLTWLDTVADTLEDEALLRPLFVVVEADALRDALAHTELTAEGPVPFTAKLVHGGTLQVLLDTIDLFTSLLPEETE